MRYDNALLAVMLLLVVLANQACFTARMSVMQSFCRKISIPSNYTALSPTDQCRSKTIIIVIIIIVIRPTPVVRIPGVESKLKQQSMEWLGLAL